jgi:hypothetical protein
MTATFNTIPPNTTITFSYVAQTAKIQQVVTDCSHYLWNQGYGKHNIDTTFESLTNQQKLDLIDLFLRNSILDMAKSFSVNLASNTARDQAVIDDSKNHDIG